MKRVCKEGWGDQEGSKGSQRGVTGMKKHHKCGCATNEEWVGRIKWKKPREMLDECDNQERTTDKVIENEEWDDKWLQKKG